MTAHFVTLLYQFEILTFSSTGSKLFEGRERDMQPLLHVRASKYTTIYEVRRKFIVGIFHNFQKTCRFWPRPDRWPWPLWPWPSNFEVSLTCTWHWQSVTLICVKVTEKNGVKFWHLTLNISNTTSRSRSRSHASCSVLHDLHVCQVWPVSCQRLLSYSVPKIVSRCGTRNVTVGNTRAYINTRVQIVYIGVDTPNSSTLRRDSESAFVWHSQALEILTERLQFTGSKSVQKRPSYGITNLTSVFVGRSSFDNGPLSIHFVTRPKRGMNCCRASNI
jgi:hypothetical protein